MYFCTGWDIFLLVPLHLHSRCGVVGHHWSTDYLGCPQCAVLGKDASGTITMFYDKGYVHVPFLRVVMPSKGHERLKDGNAPNAGQ